MANQFLNLSLFMMLLSFFIILTAMSNYEDSKAKSAISSVTIAFSKQAKPDSKSAEMEEDPMKALNQGTTLDQIKALFETQMSGLKVAQNRLGTEMQIRLDQREFEKMLYNPIKTGDDALSNKDNLFPLLLSLLNSEDSIPYRMDIMLHTNDNPASLQNEAPSQLEAPIDDAARYATKIVELGLPDKLITAGLTQGSAGTVDLVFRRYIQFDPTPLDLQNGEGAAP